jgi:hypothetical protein
MCFVSFLPTSEGFLLGSNRDENRQRLTAAAPQTHSGRYGKLVLPIDRKAGGTWIAAREDGWVAVLLNGAFEPHIPAPPYRQSRGVIIPEIMQHPLPDLAFSGLVLENTEPFTLIIAGKNLLKEWRWDGHKKSERDHDFSEARCWSSVTLYNPEQVAAREGWFLKAVASGVVYNSQTLAQWHAAKGKGEPHFDIMLNRADGLLTVSTTIIEKLDQTLLMHYTDYLSGFRTMINPVIAASVDE